MKKQIDQLIEWHKKFEVPYRTEPCPFDDSDENIAILRLRCRIMMEEVKEWEQEAIYNSDIDKRAKELADILYTVFGTIITEGLQDVIEKVFDAVHESNMSKLGEDGKPFKRADGKVLKGSNYKEPDLSFLLNKKDIYWQGKIYQGVSDEDLEVAHFHFFNIAMSGHTSYEVIGNHNFTDGMDVTGLYTIHRQVQRSHKWEFSGSFEFRHTEETERRMVAIPIMENNQVSKTAEDEIVEIVDALWEEFGHALSRSYSEMTFNLEAVKLLSSYRPIHTDATEPSPSVDGKVWVQSEQEFIVCSAIEYFRHPTQPIIVCGLRHNDCINTYYNLTGDQTHDEEQGFLTSKNRFVNRIEAGQIALDCGQIKELKYYGGKMLDSSDLYHSQITHTPITPSVEQMAEAIKIPVYTIEANLKSWWGEVLGDSPFYWKVKSNLNQINKILSSRPLPQADKVEDAVGLNNKNETK